MSPLRALLIAVIVNQVSVQATTIYLHRCLAHRAVRLHPAVNLFFRFALWLTTGLRGREWAAVHRKHHRYTDTPDDPHSPILLGFWKVQLGNALLYRRAARDPLLVRKYAPELKPDRWDRVLFDHGIAGVGLGIVITVLTCGLRAALVIVPTHIVLYLMLNAAINAVGHSFGYQRFAGTSATNMRVLAFLTGGEGLHNNHHGRPASAVMAVTRGEKLVDAGWAILRLLEMTRLATLRRPTGATVASRLGRKAA